MTFWKQSSETFVLRGNRITCYSSYSNCPALPSLSVPTAPAPAREPASRALSIPDELRREMASGRHGVASGADCRLLAFVASITKALRCSLSFLSHPCSFTKARILGLNILSCKNPPCPSLVEDLAEPSASSRMRFHHITLEHKCPLVLTKYGRSPMLSTFGCIKVSFSRTRVSSMWAVAAGGFVPVVSVPSQELFKDW